MIQTKQKKSIHSQAQVEGETGGDTYQGKESIYLQAQVEEETEKDTDQERKAFIHKVR